MFSATEWVDSDGDDASEGEGVIDYEYENANGNGNIQNEDKLPEALVEVIKSLSIIEKVKNAKLKKYETFFNTKICIFFLFFTALEKSTSFT